jgi:mono/diheme cytochrome c family protein
MILRRLLLVAVVLSIGLPAPADADQKACRKGCKVLQQGCMEDGKADFTTAQAACPPEGAERKTCRRAAKQTAKQAMKACRTFTRTECKPCCKVGGLDECAKQTAAMLEAEPQEAGDPVEGRRLLLNGDYMTCGAPYKVWSFGPAQDLFAGAFGGGADAPRIGDREGKNADMPYFMNAFTAPDGAEVVNGNCLMCHGGLFDGKLVVGLGNAIADFTAGAGGGLPGGSLDGIADLLGLDELERVQLDRIAERGRSLTPYTTMRTIGMNPAEMFAVILMVHHDQETLAWSNEPLTPYGIYDRDGNVIEDPRVTSDPPPWWRAHKKHALFYNGMARGDHRGTMALATSVCVDTRERAQEVDDMFRDIQAYVASVRPPAYPRSIDAALAAEGEPLFLESCAGCHGTYSTDESQETYPNLLLPLDAIGTDPVVAEAGVVHAPQLVTWYNDSFYGEITRMEPNDPFPGYMPPPLDGIWATAPFLHNGSVPNLELVLNSRKRPTYWRRVDLDSTNFDETTVGWPFVEVPYPQDEAPEDERSMVYDTTKFSQSNAGHTFGDHLTDDERRAVLEYLKTL